MYFHNKSITFDYVLEDIIMPLQYAQTTYVNAVLSLDVYFALCNQSLLYIVKHMHLSFMY